MIKTTLECFPSIGGAGGAITANIATNVSDKLPNLISILIFVIFSILGALIGYAVKSLLDAIIENTKLRKQMKSLDGEKKK